MGTTTPISPGVKGQGVLIFTDMFGGTPSNISLSLLQPEKIDVLTGANLPMLLRILGMREQNLSQLVLEAKNAAIQGIVAAGEVLSRKITGAWSCSGSVLIIVLCMARSLSPGYHIYEPRPLWLPMMNWLPMNCAKPLWD